MDRRHLRRNLNVELAEFDAFVGTAVFPNLGEWDGDGSCTIGSCHLVHNILVFLCDARLVILPNIVIGAFKELLILM